jgi:hypothetical protein
MMEKIVFEGRTRIFRTPLMNHNVLFKSDSTAEPLV